MNLCQVDVQHLLSLFAKQIFKFDYVSSANSCILAYNCILTFCLDYSLAYLPQAPVLYIFVRRALD